MRLSRRSLLAVSLLVLLPLGVFINLEPRALVLLRVEGADGRPVHWRWGPCVLPLDGEAPRVGSTHVSVRDGLGTLDERPCAWALQIGWPLARTLLLVRPATAVGFVAFDQRHGLVEHVLTPEPTPGAASWSLRAVTLRLPEAAAPATVTFDLTEPAAEGSATKGNGDAHYIPQRRHDLHAPRTGLQVATLWGGGSRGASAVLPPGSYVLQVSTAPFMLCGNMPPVRHESIDVSRPFDVRSREALTVEHRLERGGWLALTATVTGAEAFAAANAPALARCFDSCVDDAAFDTDAAWAAATVDELEATLDVDPLLHVTARLTPSAGGPTFVPSFTSPDRQSMGGRRRAILGTRADMLEQLPPGEYVLSLSGPRVVSWSTTVTLERDVCTEVQVSFEPRGPWPRSARR